ncbi:MAG: hypothetical protein JJU33_04435 [Phycisphaerales bacterium]|nr:hypothetical protein [Phycisphaerales bacterium]
MSEIDEQTEALKGLHELLGELPQEPAECPDPACPKGTDAPLARLVESFMWWEAGGRHAPAAVEKLCAELVDYNELRICLPDEVLAIIGTKYPRGQERCERLNAALNAVYNREHALNLETLLSMPKREARVYLDGLDGITPFIASRVMLLTLGAHAFPVDSRVASVLSEASIAEPDEQPAQIAAKMERLLRAGECREIYLGVERLIETPRKPKVKAEPQPKSEPKPDPEPEPIAEPLAEPATAPAPEPAPKPAPEPAPEPVPEQSQAEPAPSSDDETTPKPHPEPGTE